ncbi:MAG: choline kinase family protein [Paracoccaceae bacterium]|nr:choline kinase family protein [Paracoccaceae bacterium]
MEVELKERLFDAVNSIPGWSWEEVQVSQLHGGVTNENFVVTHNNHQSFMKVFGKGTENFINRDSAYDAAVQAQNMGITPKVLHYSKNDGVEVSEFLDNYRASLTSDFSRKDFLEKVIDLYATFHSGNSLSETKNVFEMTQEHIDQGQELSVDRPPDFDWLYKQYSKAREAFFASGLDLVPCHNDPMPGNFMVFMENNLIKDMKLIDFEYASNNERAYEIGVFLQEVFIDEKTSLEMIERYYGEVRTEIVARVTVARAVADMKWGNWALQQRKLQDWDFDYQKYGIWKLARARIMFNDPRWDDWLRSI